MIALLLALVSVQADAWRVTPANATVGDTIRIERLLPAPAGATGRTQALTATDIAEPLGPPALVGRPNALLVRHTVAFFAPGDHRLAMPAVELVSPDGHVEMILGDTAVIAVQSVLPDTGASIAPRASRAPLARPLRRPERPVALAGGVLAALMLWGYARRRTGPRPQLPDPVRDEIQPPLMRWLSAGETRAVATLASDRIRSRIAIALPDATRSMGTAECVALVRHERPDWPVAEVEDLLFTLDRSRFAPLAPSDAADLADRAEELLPRLRVETDT